jgi:hypothetical protein
MRGTVSTLDSTISNPLHHTMMVTMGTGQDAGLWRSILPYPDVQPTLHSHQTASAVPAIGNTFTQFSMKQNHFIIY